MHEEGRQHGEGGCAEKAFETNFFDELMADSNLAKT